jgi:hypothetical protein
VKSDEEKSCVLHIFAQPVVKAQEADFLQNRGGGTVEEGVRLAAWWQIHHV